MQNTFTQGYSGDLSQLNSNYKNDYNKPNSRNLFIRFFEWLKRQNRINRTSKELSSLSDHQLADIGISRFDIKDISSGKYQRTNSLKYYL